MIGLCITRLGDWVIGWCFARLDDVSPDWMIGLCFTRLDDRMIGWCFTRLDDLMIGLWFTRLDYWMIGWCITRLDDRMIRLWFTRLDDRIIGLWFTRLYDWMMYHQIGWLDDISPDWMNVWCITRLLLSTGVTVEGRHCQSGAAKHKFSWHDICHYVLRQNLVDALVWIACLSLILDRLTHAGANVERYDMVETHKFVSIVQMGGKIWNYL